jgi:hypothetical protein
MHCSQLAHLLLQGLNTVRSTILVTVIVVFGCIGVGIFAALLSYAPILCIKMRDKWRRPQVRSQDSDQQQELTGLSKTSETRA